jgi:hypothetical protein
MEVICYECGAKFKTNLELAGHIARSNNHVNKRWAMNYLSQHLKNRDFYQY